MTEQPQTSRGSNPGVVDTVTGMTSTAKGKAVTMVEDIAPSTISQDSVTSSAGPAHVVTYTRILTITTYKLASPSISEAESEFQLGTCH